jgi:Flp pilus assembly protein TadB
LAPTLYRSRPHAFAGERTYTLTDDALAIEEDGKPRDGAFYDSISEIRLAYAPTRFARNRYRAQVVFRDGGMAELFNTHYAGVGDFPERNAEYSGFLTELHKRLAANGNNIRFTRGNSPAAYIGNWLLTIFVFAMLALAFVLLVAWGLVWIAVVKIAIILFFIPTLIRYMARAKPGTYDPLAIPEDVLPR